MNELEKLIEGMTLLEKVGQLNQRLYGWQVYEKKNDNIILTDLFKNEVKKWDGIGTIYGVFRADPWSGKDLEAGLSKLEAKKVSHMIQQYIQENTRLKIPVLLSEECPHGHQGLDSLTTPVNYTVGSSWNPELYADLQAIVASELREKGAHLGLISTLDVVRDPRWGRTEECFSEDPFLTGIYTKAALLGLQGEPSDHQIDFDKVIAVLKHFAAQGSSMGGHNAAPVDINIRELKEIHTAAMREGIKFGASMCMAAYNDFQGIPCHANSYLLNDLLRNELGFQGAVMSDGCALEFLSKIKGDKAEAAAWAVTSGVDIGLWDNIFPYLEEAVITGLLDETILDKAVYRVLAVKEKLGLFNEKQSLVELEEVPEEKKRELSISLVEESIVLLKNNGLLPLDSHNHLNIALIGPNANNLYNQLGDYSPFKREKQGITIKQAMETRLKSTQLYYTKGSEVVTTSKQMISEAVSVAEKADVIILAIGGSSTRDFQTSFDLNGAAIDGSIHMTSGENIDVADLSLPEAQLELIDTLSQLGKPMIGVLIQGRPHSIEHVLPLFDALLLAGYPGEYGGEAITKIILGEACPTGKLAVSIPYSSSHLPAYYNYRDLPFQKTYYDGLSGAQFKFGYGLTYTNFECDTPIIIHDKAGLKVRGSIKNIGDIRSAETIQVYIKSHNKHIVTRVKELRGFKKVWLNPKEQLDYNIDIPNEDLTEYDENMIERQIKEMTVMVEATDLFYSKKIMI